MVSERAKKIMEAAFLFSMAQKSDGKTELATWDMLKETTKDPDALVLLRLTIARAYK